MLVTIGGIYSVQKIEVDVFPDLTSPTVVVLTDATGMAPEEVERLVTFPIETAVNGATNVRRVRSTSSQGFSFVWVEFDWGVDIYKARQVVSEKLVTLTDALPQGITPMLAPQSSVMGEILFVGLQADTTSLMEVRTLAEWVLKPAILATGGVSQVTIIGGDFKQYQVLADVDRMAVYGAVFSAKSTIRVDPLLYHLLCLCKDSRTIAFFKVIINLISIIEHGEHNARSCFNELFFDNAKFSFIKEIKQIKIFSIHSEFI